MSVGRFSLDYVATNRIEYLEKITFMSMSHEEIGKGDTKPRARRFVSH